MASSTTQLTISTDRDRSSLGTAALIFGFWLAAFIPVAFRVRTLAEDPSTFGDHPYTILLGLALVTSIISLVTTVATLCFRGSLRGISLIMAGFAALLAIDSHVLNMPAWRIAEQIIGGLATVGALFVGLSLVRMCGFRIATSPSALSAGGMRYPIADLFVLTLAAAAIVWTFLHSGVGWEFWSFDSSYLIGLGASISMLSTCLIFATLRVHRMAAVLTMVGAIPLGYFLASTVSIPLLFAPAWYGGLLFTHCVLLGGMLAVFLARGFRLYKLDELAASPHKVSPSGSEVLHPSLPSATAGPERL